MEFKLKASSQGHIYFPKKILEAFGEELTLLPNTEAGVIYSKGADPARVIASLEVIISDLKLRIKNEG